MNRKEISFPIFYVWNMVGISCSHIKLKPFYEISKYCDNHTSYIPIKYLHVSISLSAAVEVLKGGRLCSEGVNQI